MEKWITQADVDGFNIGHVAVPQAWEDVVEFLLPEMKARGWLVEGYPVPGGTARENLNAEEGRSRLAPTHPGSRFKFEEWNALEDGSRDAVENGEVEAQVHVVNGVDSIKRKAVNGVGAGVETPVGKANGVTNGHKKQRVET